ncbi:MAG: hypothetical protein NZ879_08435, partial [Archaeoglobaceae archaeon]|nr:hypothetical protein [Archaeoglobaceae archaeon]MDW8118992.1 hypothetical protein [Archaeoglobaceae archaeon]
KDLAEKNNLLASELEKYKSELENCSKNATSLEKRIENFQTLIDTFKIEMDQCNSELNSLKNFLSNSSFYLEVFKNLTILALAFIVGTFLAMLRRY